MTKQSLATPTPYGSMPSAIEAALDDHEVAAMIRNLVFNHDRRQAELRRQYEEKSDEFRAGFLAQVAKIHEAS